MEITKTLYVTNREDWRAWLRAHHAREREVWLIYYKKDSGRARIPYDDAVEEALCYGWIDSTVKRIDDARFAQRFTPRKDNGNWSESNKVRLRRLMKEGRMTPVGLQKIGDGVLAEKEGAAQQPAVRKVEPTLPRYLSAALRADAKAWRNFKALAPSYRRDYVNWITSAKRAETRARRLAEAVARLARNEKLGMK
jgi:uncharacterized protein YdeI (YjbR/CyaY-like superfamily)